MEQFDKVVRQAQGVTFREQTKWWLDHIQRRKRKPIAPATLELWKGCLEKWINSNIGDLPLSEVNNSALKVLVAKMSNHGLSPKTITGNYVPVVKMVVASAVDEQGEQIYPRKWNHDFIDLPVPQKDQQNTPSFSAEVMTGLARWKKPRERMIFILCGAAGLRIGEVLGIEIDKHISCDFLTLYIQQQVRRGKIEQRLKTANAVRQVDLHPAIATRLKQFVGRRKVGLLFCTRTGKQLSPTNIVRRHLHMALKELNYMNPHTGTHKAGNHAFRRFRNTYLRNYTECPEGLYKYWMGHAARDMSDLYDKVKEDVEFRRKWAERCGFGFEQLAKTFPGAVLVFSTLRKSLTKKEITGITRIAKAGKKHWKSERPINPVLILTGTELLGQSGPPYCWEESLRKKFDHFRGLIGLCDATQQMYLNLPSWQSDWHDKWEKRRQRLQAQQNAVPKPIS